MTPAEVKRFVGKQVTIYFIPSAHSLPATGKLIGTVDAADGLVAMLEPANARPGSRQSIHYHLIQSIQEN